MSQDVFTKINPSMSGEELAETLDDFKDALVSGLSGTSRPAQLKPGGYWVDTTNDPSTWSFRLWTGVDDVEVFKIDIIGGGAGVSLAVDTFTVRKISNDDVGAVLDLVKRRVNTNGQVKENDVIAQIRLVGRQDNSVDPVVASIVATAEEDISSTAQGTKLSFFIVPEGSDSNVEHLRFSGGFIESLVPHKFTAIEYSQVEITDTTITSLAADNSLVRIVNNSNDVSLYGIDSSSGKTKSITIVNRGSKTITLYNESSSATAEDRLSIAEGRNIVLETGESASFIYNDALDRWVLQYAFIEQSGLTVHKIHGQDTTVTVNVPNITVTGYEEPIYPVYASSNYMIGLSEIGAAYGWGQDDKGTLSQGSSSTVAHSSALAISSGAWTNHFKEVSLGYSHSVLLDENGDAYTSGINTGGELGDPSVPLLGNISTLRKIDTGGLKLKSIAAGKHTTYLIDTEGNAYSCGEGNLGKLGAGDTTPRSSPTAIVGGLKFRQIVSSPLAASVIGIDENGDAYGWGDNVAGQLGTGNTTRYSSPVAVVGSYKFKQASVGHTVFGSYVIAITTDGTPYAWGANDGDSVSLGVGDSIEKSSPVAVVGGLKFKQVAAGGGSIFGITMDGELYAWGRNNYGQLGLDDTTNRTSPTAISGLTFKYVCCSDENTSTFGVTEDGKLYVWGRNNFGQLGLGDVTDRSTPTAILGSTVWVPKNNPVTRFLNVTPGSIQVEFTGSGAYVNSVLIGKNIKYLEISHRA